MTAGCDAKGRDVELSVRPLLNTQTRSPHLTSAKLHQPGPQLVPDIRRERAVEMVTKSTTTRETEFNAAMMFQALLWLSLLSAVAAQEYPKVVQT